MIMGRMLVTQAYAQETAGPVIERLQVDLWPEYDDPRLLVIYKGDLTAPPDQPLRFPIPADADVNAVAYVNEEDRLITMAWDSEAANDRQVITFTLETSTFQLEYYLDAISSGPDKTFTVNIDVDGQSVDVLGIAVQQPVGASNLQGEPALSAPVEGFQGLSYYTRQIEGVDPGQRVQQTVTYTKPDDRLSVNQIQTAPTAMVGTQPATTPSGSTFSTNVAGRSVTRFWLPLGAAAIIVAGLVLIGMGTWRARQASQLPGKARPSSSRRGPRRTKEETAVASGPVGQVHDEPAKFCHQCGAAFEPEDRFCAECGAPRRG